jgi:hypothetical protein
VTVLGGLQRQPRFRRTPQLHAFIARLSAPPPVAAPPDDEDDDDTDYFRFIASDIRADGVVLRDERVELAPIAPTMLQAKAPPGAAIDQQFWQDLDSLDALLRATRKIEETGDGFWCRICKKKFKSGVRLLQHCWELHRDQLGDYD